MPVRLRLKEIFDVPRSTGTEVHNQTVISDGHTHKDLANITIEKMQAFLETKEKDFFKLWNATAGKVYMQWEKELDDRMEGLKEEKMRLGQEKLESLKELTKEVEEFANSVQETVKPKKRGRPKKITV